MLDEGRQVVGVGVHLVALRGLAGTTVAAAVVSDTAIAIGGQEKHLRFPAIGREGPAVAENNRLSSTSVFVIDIGAVFGGDHAHRLIPPFRLCQRCKVARQRGFLGLGLWCS